MLRYSFSLLLLLSFCLPALAQDLAEDEGDEQLATELDTGKQLRFGIDITRPIYNILSDGRSSYEFAFDYYYKKELYFVAEGGWGSADVDYADLKYSSSNAFIRVGIDKSLLKRLHENDWDMVFVGLRYGVSFIQRSDASFTIFDDFWGNYTGTIPAQNFTGHWAEITGGVKLEVYKGLYIGWNVRGKFLLNSSKFEELPPSFVAGYGKGDRNTIFDYNFYLSYALRWGKKETTPVAPTAPRR